MSSVSEPQPAVKAPLLVLGLSRTGGTSLSRALATLGYPKLYDLDDIANGGPEHGDFWLQAVTRKLHGQPGFSKPQADALLSKYNGVRNVPAAAFAAELVQCYPQSKVILPLRDVESWHASCLTTVYQRSVDPVLRLLAFVDPASRFYAKLLQALQQVLYRGDFPNYGKTAFVEHNAYLRETVPQGLLLEYRVQDGWAPLCKFLEVPIPASEFPRSNDKASFWKGCRSRDATVASKVVIKALVVSGLLGVAWTLRGPVVATMTALTKH